MAIARYERNLGAFSQQELDRVRSKTVLVVGCGGLGGYLCQCLARFGVGKIIVADGDVFTQSNLNRQLFADASSLGRNKAVVAEERLRLINSEVEVCAHPMMLDGHNADSLLDGCDVAVDCLDSAAARLVLAQAAERAGIVLVHGAVQGYYGQVANVYPGDDMIQRLYQNVQETQTATPAFTPMVVAGVQSTEVIKLLTENNSAMRNQMLFIDLLETSFRRVQLS